MPLDREEVQKAPNISIQPKQRPPRKPDPHRIAMKVNDPMLAQTVAEYELVDQMLASRDEDVLEAGAGGTISPFNKKAGLVHNRQAAAKNPLLTLGGGKDPIEKGKAAFKGDNVNTKPTNAADMYAFDASIPLVKKNLDEFPVYEKDEASGDLIFRRQGSDAILKSPS